MRPSHPLRADRRLAPPTPRLLPLALPLFAEMALGIGMGLVGTVLAARLGDAQGAAFALCNQVLAMLFVFFRIIGAGVGVVVAQALGGQPARRGRGHGPCRLGRQQLDRRASACCWPVCSLRRCWG